MWITLHSFKRYYTVCNFHLKYLNYQKYWYSNAIKRNELSVHPESVQEKIIYNSLITPKSFLEVIKNRRKVLKNALKMTASNNPVSLKLLDNDSSEYMKPNNSEDVQRLPSEFELIDKKPNLPFKYNVDYGVSNKIYNEENNVDNLSSRGVSIESIYADESIKGAKSWMNDYEKYCEFDEGESYENSDWLVNYGTPDPDIPISKVACGGCGAYLHCQEPSLPGYLPSEIFLECKKTDLKSTLCQRCHFLKNYNTALSVQVNPDKYVELIARIKQEALVLLMVDLTDISGSIWPDITDVIGINRNIFLIGNKVDLLWGDRQAWLSHVESVLRNSVLRKANVLATCLISAKTGFGVEELISRLHEIWKNKNDVYLVGCTNVGKSTLFNALIQSDYCKTKAVDLVQRATTAPWPGTTLNLLKFPILRPSAWRLTVRNSRLNIEKSKIKTENSLRKLQLKAMKKRPKTPPQLIGNIAHTFKPIPEQDDVPDLFNVTSQYQKSELESPRVSLVDSKIPDFDRGKWVFDTPGVLHKQQILNLLTAEELLLTIHKDIIMPRTFLLYSGMSLFIAGLTRLDYIEGDKGVRLTVFSSNTLPITVCKTEHSDDVYEGLLGTELMLVPQGSELRLKEWPGLTATDPIILCGIDKDESCADITFSTTGWIAVTPETKSICKFLAWSPLKRGIDVRHPPLLPFAVKLRGKKMYKSPAYSDTKSLFL